MKERKGVAEPFLANCFANDKDIEVPPIAKKKGMTQSASPRPSHYEPINPSSRLESTKDTKGLGDLSLTSACPHQLGGDSGPLFTRIMTSIDNPRTAICPI